MILPSESIVNVFQVNTVPRGIIHIYISIFVYTSLYILNKFFNLFGTYSAHEKFGML